MPDSASISIFNPTTVFNVNFKNCLSVMGRHLENLILAGHELLADWLSKITDAIARVRQKIRPGRNYLRFSHKIKDKWSDYRNRNIIKV